MWANSSLQIAMIMITMKDKLFVHSLAPHNTLISDQIGAFGDDFCVDSVLCCHGTGLTLEFDRRTAHHRDIVLVLFIWIRQELRVNVQNTFDVKGTERGWDSESERFTFIRVEVSHSKATEYANQSLAASAVCTVQSQRHIVNEWTFEELLRAYFVRQRLEYKCGRPDCDGMEVEVSSWFTQIPCVLVLPIKRFIPNYLTNSYRKSHDKVQIEKTLDIHLICNETLSLPPSSLDDIEAWCIFEEHADWGRWCIFEL